MRRLVLITAIVAAAVGGSAVEAGAQGARGNGRSRVEPPVPAAYQPPPGMCRIWLEGVPPGQQPAPTDCATAVRNRPANGRVLFGDDATRDRRNGRRADREDTSVGRNDLVDRSDDADERADSRPLPMMSAATQYARGERPADAARWLGGQALTAKISESGRNGAPTRVLWLNDVGDVVQIWLDRDRDGRADRIEMYRDGRRVQSVGQ